MRLKLRIWRQANAGQRGRIVAYEVGGLSPDMSFLEVLDLLNENLTRQGEEPVAFDHDCREGICGMCSMVIDGVPHGPQRTTACQLHLRHFTDGQTVDVEPWRARAFPGVPIVAASGLARSWTTVAATRAPALSASRPSSSTEARVLSRWRPPGVSPTRTAFSPRGAPRRCAMTGAPLRPGERRRAVPPPW